MDALVTRVHVGEKVEHKGSGRGVGEMRHTNDHRLRSSVRSDRSPGPVFFVSDVLGLVSRKVDHARRALVQRDHCPSLHALLEVEPGLGLWGEIGSPRNALIRRDVDYNVRMGTMSSYMQVQSIRGELTGDWFHFSSGGRSREGGRLDPNNRSGQHRVCEREAVLGCGRGGLDRWRIGPIGKHVLLAERDCQDLRVPIDDHWGGDGSW